jgi:hypothetical protein
MAGLNLQNAVKLLNGFFIGIDIAQCKKRKINLLSNPHP